METRSKSDGVCFFLAFKQTLNWFGVDGDYITMDRVIEELTAIFEPEYAAEIVEFIETHPDDHPPVKISPHLIELLRVPQNPTGMLNFLI